MTKLLMVAVVVAVAFLAHRLWPSYPGAFVFALVPFTVMFIWWSSLLVMRRWDSLRHIKQWNLGDILAFLGLALALIGVTVGLGTYFSDRPSLRIIDASGRLPNFDDGTFVELIKRDTALVRPVTNVCQFTVKNVGGGTPDVRVGLRVRPPSKEPSTDLDISYVWTRLNGFPARPDSWDSPHGETVHQQLVLEYKLLGANDTADIALGYAVGKGGRLDVRLSPGGSLGTYDLGNNCAEVTPR